MIVALAQMTSIDDVAHNLKICQKLAKDAASQGADWILYPENAPYLGHEEDKLHIATALEPNPILNAFRSIADTHRMWVTIGSFAETGPTPQTTYNTQVLINPYGAIISGYRKIHLFDAILPSGQKLCESDAIAPGKDLIMSPVDVRHELWSVGMSICYDLRFPELYRQLAARGAHILTVPSAFTVPTGHAHWHALLCARAIENQCYVLAPNQWGIHSETRASFGQSVIYDPWGRMLACAPDRTCVITAELDMESLRTLRTRMPVLDHRRL